MNKEKLYKLGEKLDITETEIKATLKRNRYKVIAGAVIISISLLTGSSTFQGLHYTGVSIRDFGFFMRFV